MFNADDLACLQKLDCSICDFPPYQFHSFPDAVNLMCWNSCSPRSTSSQNVIDRVPLSSSSSTSTSGFIELTVHSMVRDGSLTMANIVWNLEYKPSQCLVTWEVFGGGIMGNLLTDTSEAQLSLWPDSKYHIQVTCKDKNNNKMAKSLPILIDTTNAITKTIPLTKSSNRPMVTMPSTKPLSSHQQYSPSQSKTNNNNVHYSRQHDKTEVTTITQHQTTKPFHTEQEESVVHNNINNNNNDNVIGYKDAIDSNTVGVLPSPDNNEDNDVGVRKNVVQSDLSLLSETRKMVMPPLAQPHIQLTKVTSSAIKVKQLGDATVTAAMAAKPSKSKSWKIKHIQIETTLTVFCLFILITALVICTIFSLKYNRKLTKQCDKANLISNSECEMDFNSSTTSIISQTTAMHV